MQKEHPMTEDPNSFAGIINDPDPSTGSGTGPAEAGGTGHSKSAAPPPGSQPLKSAWKQVENIGQTLGEALQGRGNVVMVRVNDDTLNHLDMLVEAELARSRSEAAALLISEGMKANQQLFGRIREITDQISVLRSQLRVSVQEEADESNQNEEGAA